MLRHKKYKEILVCRCKENFTGIRKTRDNSPDTWSLPLKEVTLKKSSSPSAALQDLRCIYIVLWLVSATLSGDSGRSPGEAQEKPHLRCDKSHVSMRKTSS